MRSLFFLSAVSPQSARHIRERLRTAALPLLFTLFGLIMGSWAARIPALQEDLHIPHSALSVVLLCGGLGAVLSFPVTSWLMANLGGKQAVLAAGLALLTDLVCIGAAPSVGRLMMAVLMLGVTAGCFDVAINAQATRLERRTGRSAMSRLHAFCCGGGLIGAGLASGMAAAHVAPRAHFALVAIPVGLLLWGAQSLLPADGAGTPERRRFALPRGPLILLGAMGFLGAMVEGSVSDWSGIFLKDHFGVTDAFAPLALSAFSITMLLARLFGDGLKARFGARWPVALGAAAGASGLVFAVCAPAATISLAGFALAGAGMALVFPFVFSAAGKEGPSALASVATMAYSGSLMGPPTMGALAHHFGVQHAMGCVAALSAAIALVAARTRKLG